MQFGKYCLDIADGQRASLVNVVGNVIGCDGLTVGYSGMVGCLLVAVGRCGRRVDVKFYGHNRLLFLVLHSCEEDSPL